MASTPEYIGVRSEVVTTVEAQPVVIDVFRTVIPIAIDVCGDIEIERVSLPPANSRSTRLSGRSVETA